jgi:hypothetical protein
VNIVAADTSSFCKVDRGVCRCLDMERRTEERFEVNFETKVIAAGRSALGRVSNISESGISLDLPFQLSAGDPVQLEMADSTVYGHVIYSRPENSSFHTGIHANRVALGGTRRSSTLHRVLMETSPLIPGLEPPSEIHLG